jgi:hypothetical protein
MVMNDSTPGHAGGASARPIGDDGLDDDGLLDQVVASVLAERSAARAAARVERSFTGSAGPDDAAAAFLGDAVAFLRHRDDAEWLVDRLKQLLAGASPANGSSMPPADSASPPPAPAAPPGTAAGPC